jgi:hypothetical protein
MLLHCMYRQRSDIFIVIIIITEFHYVAQADFKTHNPPDWASCVQGIQTFTDTPSLLVLLKNKYSSAI